MSSRLSGGADFWRKHLDGWKQSGLTQAGYCARHGLSLKNFTRWRGKALKGAMPMPAPMALVPVRLERVPTGGTVQLHSPGGWRVELTGASSAQLAELLRSLP